MSTMSTAAPRPACPAAPRTCPVASLAVASVAQDRVVALGLFEPSGRATTPFRLLNLTVLARRTIAAA